MVMTGPNVPKMLVCAGPMRAIAALIIKLGMTVLIKTRSTIHIHALGVMVRRVRSMNATLIAMDEYATDAHCECGKP